MSGLFVHGAWTHCVLMSGRVYPCSSDTANGSVLIVSSRSQIMRDYAVYTSYGDASAMPWSYQHDWAYAGTVYEVFGRLVQRTARRHIHRLLGLSMEFYAFRNYEEGVSFYVDITAGRLKK